MMIHLEEKVGKPCTALETHCAQLSNRADTAETRAFARVAAVLKSGRVCGGNHPGQECRDHRVIGRLTRARDALPSQKGQEGGGTATQPPPHHSD